LFHCIVSEGKQSGPINSDIAEPLRIDNGSVDLSGCGLRGGWEREAKKVKMRNRTADRFSCGIM